MADTRLDWKGDEVKRQVMQNVSNAWGEFSLEVEGESKRELRRGHGVLTGTARRAIHAAEPGYDWSSDDVDPEQGSPELGGGQVNGSIIGLLIKTEIGLGLKYALPLHQGHHGFSGYHFLTNGLKKAQAKLDSILTKYKVQR